MIFALFALIYGLFSLDHFTVGPFLLSRPLVMGGVAGAVFGHPTEGVALGLMAECLWIRVPPTGNGHWDVGLAVALACVWAFERSAVNGGPVAHSEEVGSVPMALGFLLAIPFAVLGRLIDQWVRRHMRMVSQRALWGVEHGLVGPLRYGLVFSAMVWMLKSLVLFFLAESVGGGLYTIIVPRITGIWAEGLTAAWNLWLLLGMASILHHLSGRVGKGRFWPRGNLWTGGPT